MCINYLEHLTRCLGLSELLTEFNVKASAFFLFHTTWLNLPFSLKQECDLRIIYKMVFEDIFQKVKISFVVNLT